MGPKVIGRFARPASRPRLPARAVFHGRRSGLVGPDDHSATKPELSPDDSERLASGANYRVLAGRLRLCSLWIMTSKNANFETARQRFERFLATADDAQLDEFRINRNRMADTMNAMHIQVASRWSLSLGIANGAGLTAVGSKMLGENIGPWTYLLMPSALLFGAGLCFVGLSQGLALWRIEHKAQVTEAQNIALERADMSSWREENLKLTQPLWLVEIGLEIGAGATFFLGVAYPLLVLWSRLFFTGSLLP